MFQVKRYFVLTVMAVFGVSLAVHADEPEKPNVKEILQKADAATKALTEVEYDAEFHGEGEIADRVPKVHGHVMAKKAQSKGLIGSMFGGSANLVHFKGKLRQPGMDEEIAFESASDGKKIYAIDTVQKVFTQGKDPEARSLLRGGSSLLMQEYVHPTPFSDEINAKSAKHEGVKKVGDVDCDEIFVNYQNGSQTRWFFGKEDHLPRRCERIVDNDGENQGSTILIVTKLNTAPKLSADSFKLEAPEGFEKKEYESRGGAGDAPTLLPKGSKAPAWELKTGDGKTVTLEDQKGKVVVLVFWATYNGPSRLALPGVQKLHEEFKDKGVAVWGINCWERGGGDPVEFMTKKKYTFGLLVDGDKVADKYRINNQPAFYVVGKDGKVAYASVGFLKGKEKEIAKAVENAMK